MTQNKSSSKRTSKKPPIKSLEPSLLKLINEHVVGIPTQKYLSKLAHACLDHFHSKMNIEENKNIIRRLIKEAEEKGEKEKVYWLKQKNDKIDVSKIKIEWVDTRLLQNVSKLGNFTTYVKNSFN